MSSKRPPATQAEVKKKVKEIRDYYDQGRASLELPSAVSIRQQADDLGWNETKLRKARQFAHPTTGYSQESLDQLCDLLREHRPVFGISHIGLLVTVPWPDREGLLTECVLTNWSLRQLRTAIKKRAAPRSAGGRRRQVDQDDVLVRLEDTTTSYRRLYASLMRSHNGEPPPFDSLSHAVRLTLRAGNRVMTQLRSLVAAELAPTRGESGQD